MLKDFKKFILRGNVVDLAVGILIGTSFNGIITALTKYMVTPLITAITGKRANFANYSFIFHGSTFNYGNVVNALISFILIALIVFFLIVQPINKLITYSKKGKEVDPADKKCPECLSTIPVKATRCAFCTAKLKAA